MLLYVLMYDEQRSRFMATDMTLAASFTNFEIECKHVFNSMFQWLMIVFLESEQSVNDTNDTRAHVQ